MKIKFEYQSTATKSYAPAKQLSCMHDGKEYVRVGKSYEPHTATLWYFMQVVYLVAKAALGIIFAGIPFLFSDYRKSTFNTWKEIRNGHEKILHYTPHATSVIGLTDRMRRLVSEINAATFGVGFNLLQIRCFIYLDFEHQTIKKEFIIKSPNQNSISVALIYQKFQKIEKKMQETVGDHLGHLTQTKWFILTKDQQGHFHEMHSTKTPLLYQHEFKRGRSLSEEELENLYDEMEFPKDHAQRQSDDFIPGPFYEALPN